ncbi:DUF6234 family protein [Streptomyces sp. NPDC021356]|uniref:DUF6234 family protein n=1 Tax=Streptomyces sp. NPDC021356 TaxID=3154900 RepID=UPI0033E64B48
MPPAGGRARLAAGDRPRPPQRPAKRPSLLAAVFRAPWTVTAHLLVALLAGGVPAAVRHDGDHSHRPPPGCVRYSANC